jgi:hypothetical protein
MMDTIKQKVTYSFALEEFGLIVHIYIYSSFFPKGH